MSDRSHLPEDLLLRDTLYLLQGISGKHVQFAPAKDADNNQLVFGDDTVRPSVASIGCSH